MTVQSPTRQQPVESSETPVLSLLEGDSRLRISELVTECVSNIPCPGSYASPSLSHGAATYAMFLHEAASYLGQPRLHALAVEHLAFGVELSNESASSTSLYRSISGLGWTLSSVVGRSEDVDGFLRDVENLLLDALKTAPESMSIDLINGVAGMMVFALRSVTHTGNVSLVSALSHWYVRRFSYWITDAEREFSASSVDSNLGLAHGLPGILSVFSRAAAEGVLSEEAREVTASGFEYVDRFVIETRDRHAYVANNQASVEPARLAWCYGNLGNIFSFLRGTSMVPALAARPEQLLSYASRQYGTPLSRLNDLTLCHGLAGASLQFDLVSRDDRFNEQCRGMASMLAKRSTATLFERYSAEGSQNADADDRRTPRGGMSFLEGWPGICLALMAVDGVDRPDWLELLAL
ncbi:Lanthionine synthetase C-like protein [Luteibacter sp. 22Crub2.1]|nr:Lanthionine synthetase C-like protein [Luteibacter sp. 22Crub2.1]